MSEYDFIIAGCGICGSVIARYIAEVMDKRVLLLEKREHIAGNMYDYRNEEGILVHRYGPHIFHTNNKEVFDFITKYGEWTPYYLQCQVFMKGKYTPSPFNLQTIDDFYSPAEAQELKSIIAQQYPRQDRATIIELLNSENNAVREYAQFLFDSDYSLYTAKQWGVDPGEIDISVLKRVPVLFNYDTGYFSDTYQCMPSEGYTVFFEKLLQHENIEIRVNTDVLTHLDISKGHVCYEGNRIPLIYTGPIDALFEFDQGLLPYRSLRFEWKTVPVSSFQNAAVVAYPEATGYTRITEYNKLPKQNTASSTYAIEYPLQYTRQCKAEPYYPVLTKQGMDSYKKYNARAQSIEDLYLCGRLAEFQYYNMDQAIERAFYICKTLDKRY